MKMKAEGYTDLYSFVTWKGVKITLADSSLILCELQMLKTDPILWY